MDHAHAKRIIEGLLFVFSQPLPMKRIAEVLPELEPAQLRAFIQTLNGEYSTAQRAFRIQEVAGGYQLVTEEELAPWIKKALQAPRPDAVSTAALETLAIVAYRQPITKAEIEAIRGVDVGAALETLVERRFVRIAGRKDSPGRPFLYSTTAEFLRHFGLKSLEALPGLTLPTVQEPDGETAQPGTGSSAAEPAPSTEAAPSAVPPTPAAASTDGA